MGNAVLSSHLFVVTQAAVAMGGQVAKRASVRDLNTYTP
jgi:hypothetical protein